MSRTFYALSSGRPPAGIAIVRVSGSLAFATLARLTTLPLPPLRKLVLRMLSDHGGAVIDRAMVVRFAGPATATGDDLVEFHLHGGVAVVAAMLRVLGNIPGLTLATPGEFTRRAFDGGKLDLAQAEGLADLIDATTDSQRQQALAQADGALGMTVAMWRRATIDLLAEVEAGLDFADEEGVPPALSDLGHATLAQLRREIDAALADAARGEQVRDGLVIVITGPTNAGKSSLLNALARREVAIVSPHPGTTRDAIEVRLDLAGVAATIVDTAGIRPSDDPVETEGMRRGYARAEAADLVIALDPDAAADGRTLPLTSKADLTGTAPGWSNGRFHVSALACNGVALLEDWLIDWAQSIVRSDTPALVTRARHRIALIEARDELAQVAHGLDTVLVAEHLRRAALSLAAIIGQVGAEDVLDAIFSRFCVGK